jgi:hypothetical protein
MIRQLLVLNDFEDSEFIELSEEEETKIKDMLKKINDVFVEDNIENSDEINNL